MKAVAPSPTTGLLVLVLALAPASLRAADDETTTPEATEASPADETEATEANTADEPEGAEASPVDAPADEPEATEANTADDPEASPVDAPADEPDATEASPVDAPADEVPSLAAQGGFLTASGWDFNLTGAYRVSAEGISDMRVDAEGETYNQNELFTHRLTFAPSVQINPYLSITSEVQLMSGFLGWDSPNARFRTANDETRSVLVDGEMTDVPSTFENFGPPRSRDGAAFHDYLEELRLRKLYLTWTTPIGQVKFGRMASQWGMGILANGGDNETQDWGSPRFGQDRNYGDVVDRIMFITTPFAAISDSEWSRRWVLAAGADIVDRDERVRREDGDLAIQGVGALRYSHDLKELGLYIAHRDLRDHNQDTLRATAVDFYGKGSWRFWDFDVYGEGEFAWVLGDTSLARNNAFTENVTIQQLGWVGRVGANYVPLNLGLDVEVGYASGDSNPNDEFLRNFTFDPDYNPSLIMFDQLRAAETVATTANVSNPTLFGQPPSNRDLIPTGGSMTNAVYVRPTLRYKWEGLAARFAFMWAIAEEDIVDPYNSNRAGGGPINYQGGDGTQRELGVEFDLGVDYTYRFRSWFEAHASIQGGYFIPGAGFADADGNVPDPIGMVYARLILRWLPPPATKS